MMRPSFVIIIVILSCRLIFGQAFKVLHYTETSGYDHQTRQASLTMLQSLGSQHGFAVTDDQTGSEFNSLSNLRQYAVVVFSNTSGDQILDSAQRANFEAYINAGGSLVGIHAASDTYRHSTANGNNTGSWDWYAETLGGSVQQNPNHTTANYSGILDHIGTHFTIAATPNPWMKQEEYYYWENGYLRPGPTIVLMVRATGANSYDVQRPISWYSELAGGGRSFYTALGHDVANFSSDTAFQNHIRDAILWAANLPVTLQEEWDPTRFSLHPNPVNERMIITGTSKEEQVNFKIIDLQGKEVARGTLNMTGEGSAIDISHLKSGLYTIRLQSRAGFSDTIPFTKL